MDYRDYNDYELIYEIRENSEEAYKTIFTKYSFLINKLARTYSVKAKAYKVEYDDLVQEGYVGLSQALNDYNEDSCLFYTYASICIKREMERLIKAFSRKKNMVLSEAVSLYEPLDNKNETFLEEVLPSKECLEDDLISDIECKKIMDLRYEMPPDMAAVYELKYNKFTMVEISKLLDMPVKKVERLIQRSKLVVKKYLNSLE